MQDLQFLPAVVVRDGGLGGCGVSAARRVRPSAIGQTVHIDKFKAERLDAVERAGQGRLVQVTGEHGVGPSCVISKSANASRPVSPRPPEMVIR
jgi:hypothetical protein